MTPKTTKFLNNHKDFYKAYPLKDEVSSEEFRLILKMFFNLLRKSMIYEGKVYKLPAGLGLFGIFGKKPKKAMFDYQFYKETGVKRNLTNLHSEQKCFGIRWLPMQQVGQSFKLDYTFTFKATRAFQRELAKALKTENIAHLYYSDEVHLN